MNLQALLLLCVRGNISLKRGDSKFTELDFQPSLLTNPFFEEAKPLFFLTAHAEGFEFRGWVDRLIQIRAKSVKILSTKTEPLSGLLVECDDGSIEAWTTRGKKPGTITRQENPKPDPLRYGTETFSELMVQLEKECKIPESSLGRTTKIAERMVPEKSVDRRSDFVGLLAQLLSVIVSRIDTDTEDTPEFQIELVDKILHSEVFPSSKWRRGKIS